MTGLVLLLFFLADGGEGMSNNSTEFFGAFMDHLNAGRPAFILETSWDLQELTWIPTLPSFYLDPADDIEGHLRTFQSEDLVDIVIGFQNCSTDIMSKVVALGEPVLFPYSQQTTNVRLKLNSKVLKWQSCRQNDNQANDFNLAASMKLFRHSSTKSNRTGRYMSMSVTPSSAAHRSSTG